MSITRASIIAAGLVALSPASTASVTALDHGQFGEAWPVAEPDLLLQIKSRLESMEASGELARQNAKLRQKMASRVMDPLPLAGMGLADENRSWLYDPSITLAAPMHDDKGRLIAAAGTRVNPLDYTAFSQRLLFIDGREAEQIAWAKAMSKTQRDKVIFVGGSPFRAMKDHQQRFYFDQGGTLTSKFGITATPALVEREGHLLRISEVSLEGESSQ